MECGGQNAVVNRVVRVGLLEKGRFVQEVKDYPCDYWGANRERQGE